MALPTDYAERKGFPLFTFLTEYFPDAIEELVKISIAGNKQHGNATDKIRWERGKSTDQLNTAMRHLWDHATVGPKDTDGCYHLGKTAWRALAQLQLQIEKDRQYAIDYTEYGNIDGEGLYGYAEDYAPQCPDELGFYEPPA
jgi:hypothetical protein